MTAEQLNIKLRFDTSEIKTGVQQVKTQLTGMANTVKQSIPQISKEGKKAGTALGSVATASNKVKKSLDGIGDEAKDSLGDVVKYAKQAQNAVKGIGSGANVKVGFDAESMTEGASSASESLGELESTMSAIAGLQFGQVILSLVVPLKVVKDSFANLSASVSGTKKNVSELEGSLENLQKTKPERGGALVAKAIKNLNKEIKQVKTDGIDNIEKAARQATLAVGGLVAKIALLGAGVLAAVGIGVANASKEYNEGQAKLLSAYQSVGAGAKEATQAYRGLFRFLGDPATSVEAANHLAKLTTNTKDLAEWTKIAQGVYATFGDSLKIESLTEAANESARVGKTVSSLADALQWAGISEDAFNAQLAQTTSFAEREALIRNTLNSLYSTAAENYERNNRATILQNEATARLHSTMGRVAKTVAPLITSITNLANAFLTTLGPAIAWVSAVLSVLIDKLGTAIKWIGGLFGIEFESELSSGLSSAAGSLSGAAGSAGDLSNNLGSAVQQAQKLKRSIMGFDELNVVTDPNASAGYIPNVGAGGGMIDEIAKKTEDLKKKVKDFFDEFDLQIKIIAAALAALGVTKLLKGLGEAIDLGDNFLKTMDKIKNLAVSAITIVLQYTLVNEFMDAFIDGEGWKNYILGALTAALGTLILWSMWGTTGLAIGLGVTAVASLDAVFENGGITNVESAIVAITGLGAAILAVVAKVKDVKITKLVSDLLTNLKGKLAGIPAFISGIFTSAKTAITTVLTVIKTAFTTVIKFIIANPIALVIAAIVALVALIAVKGDEIQAALNKVSDWLKKIFVKDWREVLGPTLGTIMNGFVKVVGDIFGNVKKIFNGVIDFIRGVFTGNWKRAWEGVKSIFSGVFGGIKAVAKAPLNSVISLVNGALVALTNGFNWVKRQLNNLSIKIPDWVPKYGGSRFGFNLAMSSAPQIPMLAKGGISNGSTLVNFGERGREAILPLENNTGWMDILADRIASRNQAPSKIVLMVDGKELGWAAINNINGITKQTGGLQLCLI